MNDGGNFGITSTGGTHPDAYLVVYSSFDPNAPLENVVLGDDDGGAGLLPGIGNALGDPAIPNGGYYVVVTAFANGTYGTLDFEIFGVTLGFGPSVPDLKQDLITHASHLRRSGVVGTMAALQFPGQQTSGAQVSTQGTAAGGLQVWSDIGGGQLKGAVTGTTRSLKLGALSELENGAVIGAILKRGNFALESSASSLEGSSLMIQPYLSTRMGQTEVTIGFGLGRTDYDEYTLGATTGTANSRTSEVFAKVGYRFEIDSDASITAYGSVLAGREAMEFGGGLAAASDETVTYSYSAVGLNYQRALSAATMLTSSLEVGRYRDNGVGTSTTIDTSASDGANIAIGLGLEGYTNGGMQWAINANASNQGGTWVGSGVTAGLKISF